MKFNVSKILAVLFSLQLFIPQAFADNKNSLATLKEAGTTTFCGITRSGVDFSSEFVNDFILAAKKENPNKTIKITAISTTNGEGVCVAIIAE